MIIGMLILCGLGTVAVPYNRAEKNIQLQKISPQKTQTMQAALEIELTAGFGITAKITNIGIEDALDVTTQLDISIGNRRHFSVYYNTSRIAPGESISFKKLVFGLNTIFVAAYADATNAVKCEGIGMGTLLFFYIIKWYAYNPPGLR